MIGFRKVVEADWSVIGWLASDEVQDGNHAGWDGEWVAQRRSFVGTRLDSVAGQNGEIVGYCAVERGEAETGRSYRAFLVADWRPQNRTIHEALLGKVEEFVNQEGADRVWMRELTGDRRLLDFVTEHGFELGKPYTIGGREIVNASRELSRVA